MRASASNEVVRSLMAAYSWPDRGRFARPEFARLSHTVISRSGSLKGRGRSRTALTTLKIAELAPMPSASVMTAIAVNPGLFDSDRRPNRMSLIMESTMVFPISDCQLPIYPRRHCFTIGNRQLEIGNDLIRI